MPAISRLIVPLAALSSIVVATATGHFDDTSVCADPKGMGKCFAKAEKSYANCITSNCSGGSKSCYNSCNGDTTCMATQCPNLGVDCINACGCVRATDQIDCTASSCWNQVRAARYSHCGDSPNSSLLPRFTLANTSKRHKMSSTYASNSTWIKYPSGPPQPMLRADALAILGRLLGKKRSSPRNSQSVVTI